MIGFNRRHRALIRKATVACKNLNRNLSVKESNIHGDIHIMNTDTILLTFSHLPSCADDVILAYAGTVNNSKKDFFYGCPVGNSTGYYEWNKVLSIQPEDVEDLINWSWNKIQNN